MSHLSHGMGVPQARKAGKEGNAVIRGVIRGRTPTGSTCLSAPAELSGIADVPREGPELLQLRRAVDSDQRLYAAAETVPIDGVADWPRWPKP
jgi:hypothetical protein